MNCEQMFVKTIIVIVRSQKINYAMCYVNSDIGGENNDNI